MKLLILVIVSLLCLDVRASAQMCASVFETIVTKETQLISPDGKKVAVLSEDQHFLRIVNLRTGSEYTYDTNEVLNGFFGPNSKSWISAQANEVLIWNFEREVGNLIRVILKNPIDRPHLFVHKDSTTGRYYLEIIYRRKKISPDNRQYFTTVETIRKDLETFEETRL